LNDSTREAQFVEEAPFDRCESVPPELAREAVAPGSLPGGEQATA